jgi:hypothetical protein
MGKCKTIGAFDLWFVNQEGYLLFLEKLARITTKHAVQKSK